MDFMFNKLDFNDILSISNYGQEVLEEIEKYALNDRTIIDDEVNDIEMQRLMDSIPISIDDEIKKNTNEHMPIHLGLMDQLLSIKFLDKALPNFFNWKDKINSEVDELKSSDENNNTVVLYNNVMENIYKIRDKIEENYLNIEKIVESLSFSKNALIELKGKFDIVISEGEKTIEEYINSEDDDQLKSKKLMEARDQILHLRNARATIDIMIMQKDESALELLAYGRNLKNWRRTKFPILALGVNSSIEKKYLGNKVEQLSKLNDLSDKAVLDSAKMAKETAQKNVKMLQTGEVNKELLNKYLKDVQDAFVPMRQFIQNKETAQRKLLEDMDKIENDIKQGYKNVAQLGGNIQMAYIEDKPKQLKLEANTHNNE